MTPNLKIAAAAAVLALSAAQAKAADPQYCSAYGHMAVAQYEMGLAKGIANLPWPRWGADANAHTGWCMLPFVTRQMADSEIAARHSVIN